jgi:hypothetical protein
LKRLLLGLSARALLRSENLAVNVNRPTLVDVCPDAAGPPIEPLLPQSDTARDDLPPIGLYLPNKVHGNHPGG